MKKFNVKKMCFVVSFTSIAVIMVACQKKELINEKLKLNGQFANVQTGSFTKNLLFDENGFSQWQTDLDDPAVSTTVSNFFEPKAEAALSYKAVGYASVYNNATASASAGVSAENVKVLALKVMLTTDSITRQPYINKAAEILKSWAKVNVQSWHRPAETVFLPMYEGYSLLRSSLTSADRDTVDGWVRRRATVGAYNFMRQDGNGVNKINNWEAQRLCFLFYSAYILNDNSLLENAKSSYNTFLDNYLLEGGKTTDYQDRDAFVYQAYGLLYVGNIFRAVQAMEGSIAGDNFKNKTNKIGLKVEDAVRFWEPYLCGLYHDEFKNSIFSNERTGARRGPYNPKGDLYVLDMLVQHYLYRIYPYFKTLQSPSADRFHNLTRYIALLAAPHIDYSTSMPIGQFFSNCNNGGASALLRIGGYTASQLQQAGLSDNALSSFKIPAGVRIILFDGDFSDATTVGGERMEFTASNDCLVNTFNDKTSSIIVVGQ